MAELKIPVRIDGFKCVEDMAYAVLDYTYKGRTLKEWADKISRPITHADRIRSMTDEELADFVWGVETAGRAYGPRGEVAWLKWLKQEVEEEKA